MDFDTRVGAYGVVLQEDQLLLSLWDGPNHPVWTLPGGGMEPHETPEISCVREIEEETGYLSELQGLLGVTSRTIPAERRLHGQPRPLLASRSSSARGSSPASCELKSAVPRSMPRGCL